eukprot:TRINITY_DN69081_c0_g1_i1.p2 TRINITY_DN69081_c0_g1~~TRINITY_DN69081_c0_g1_i1.p2  ORF type:complete len:161 (+),score=32.42 TRINITY_DN69081_c0_g1_i1:31-483(+)
MYLPVVALFALSALSAAKKVGGRGFGDDYEWHDLAGGLEEAKKSGKPVMYMFHKSWCGACKNLAPRFAESAAVKEQASKFVMINLVDDEHPSDSKFEIDGGYIPRIYFGRADGSIDASIYNEQGSPQYKYFFSDPNAIAATMGKAAKQLA